MGVGCSDPAKASSLDWSDYDTHTAEYSVHLRQDGLWHCLRSLSLRLWQEDKDCHGDKDQAGAREGQATAICSRPFSQD